MPVNEKLLWSSYQALSKTEQEILRVLSVIYEPINQTSLQQLLRALDYAGSGALDKSWRDKMQRGHLIEVSGNRVRCQAKLCNALSYEAVQDGSFARIAERVDRFTSGSAWTHNDFVYNPWRYRRRLRNALFLGDEQEFLALLDIRYPWARPTEGRARALFDIAQPLVTPWFHGLPESCRYQLMRYYFDIQDLLLGESRDGYALLRECHDRGTLSAPASIALLAERALRAEEWAQYNRLVTIDAPESYAMLCVQASKAFLDGDNASAIDLFRKALTARKRDENKRIVHIEAIAGVFYCLALVKAGDAEAVARLDAQCSAATRQQTEEPLARTFQLLEYFRGLWDGRETDHTALESFKAFDLGRNYPLEVHMLGLVWYWLDKPAWPELVTQLEGHAARAAAAGIAWQSRDIERLVAAIRSNGRESVQGLAAMMPRVQAWERALDALAGLGKRPPPADRVESRLAWMLSRPAEGGPIHLEPREQKRRKDGSWSKGRPVSLRRLAEEQDRLPWMTREDDAICRHIRRNISHFPGSAYDLDDVDALLAAVGHPYVFWEHDRDNPVSVRRQSPELIVKRVDGQVVISMHPDPEIASEATGRDPYDDPATELEVLVVEGAGTVDIYEFDAAQRQISRILGGELRVPATAEDRVIQSIVAISPLMTVHADLPGILSESAETVEGDPKLHLDMQPAGNELKIAISVQPFGEGPRFLPGAGGETVFTEIGGKRVQANRNLAAESACLQRIVDLCPGLVSLGGGVWSFPDMAQALEGLLALQSMQDELVFAWPEGKRIKLHAEVGVGAASLSIRSKTDWFEITGEVVTDESDVLDMQKLMMLIGDSPGRFVRLGENEFIALTDDLRRRLDKLRAITTGGRIRGMAGLHLEELSDGMAVTADDQWREFHRRLQSAREFEPVLPGTFAGELRDYQLAGYKWLARLAAWGAGACLADDMGLGKTIQSLALITSRAERGPTLVIAPTSVCMNWMDEAARFAPTLKPILFGAGHRRNTVEDLGPFDLLICSYGLLASESDLLTNVEWCTIIADEAQAFKNANTLRSKSVMRLSGECRVITTGTPIENHLGELWNLFNFINPGLLGSLEHFNEMFARPIENGDEEARQHLKQLIAPFVLRRLKREVLAELPPRTDITLTVELSKEEAALYEALRREAVSATLATDSENRRRMIVLAQITRLRQAACNPALVVPAAGIASSKLEMFGDVVKELIENGHKALVFSQFVAHLALVRDYLDDHDITYQYLDGSTRPMDRKRAVSAFQAGDGDLFLISLKAGGTGLNLTAANYVIHLDPWWNPAVEDQASDRAHRIGQQRPVTVYRLVAADTIEQKIVELHRHKRDLADSLLEGSDIGARMTLDDMLALIGEERP